MFVWIGPILRNDRPAAKLSDMLASLRLGEQYRVQSNMTWRASAGGALPIGVESVFNSVFRLVDTALDGLAAAASLSG